MAAMATAVSAATAASAASSLAHHRAMTAARRCSSSAAHHHHRGVVVASASAAAAAANLQHRQHRRGASASRSSSSAHHRVVVRCSGGGDVDGDAAAAAGELADLASGTAHARYVQDVASLAPPAELGALTAVLQAQGMTLVPPSDRKGLHPLCVPLARVASGGDAATATTVVCLLVNANASPSDAANSGGDAANTVSVVAADGIHLRLLAKSPREYVHKALVEEEALNGDGASGGASGAVAAAAGAVGAALYEQGAFTTLGKDVPVYLTLRVAKFPDTMEALVKKHMDKDDTQSALITCDLYKGTFEGWGRPHWHVSELYTSLGRHEEARDAARFAVSDCEWATLGAPVADVLERCGWGGSTVAEVRAIVETRRGPSAAKFDGPKSSEQLAEGEATFLLDQVAAGERSVGEITQRLAECYMNSNRGSLSKLVMSSMTLF